MVGIITLFVIFNWTKDSGAWFCTHFANIRLELLMGPVKVEQLSISCLFHFFSPKSAIYMYKLVDVVGDESSCHLSFSL
jgi:hypothetical protein